MLSNKLSHEESIRTEALTQSVISFYNKPATPDVIIERARTFETYIRGDEGDSVVSNRLREGYSKSGILLEVIRNNPGVSGTQIRHILNNELSQSQISSGLSGLRIKGSIENRGGHSTLARWYIREEI